MVVFVAWESYPVTARIAHAAPKSYSENRLAANVHYDRATLSGDTVIPGTIDVRYASGYDARSAFPQFVWVSPPRDNPALNSLTPTIEVTLKSKAKIQIASIKLVIDEGAPSSKTVTNGGEGLTLTPATTDYTEIDVHYAIPPGYNLAAGMHTVRVYAANTLNLEDDDKQNFNIITGTVPPRISYTDEYNLVSANGMMSGANALDSAPWFHTSRVRLQYDADAAALNGYKIYFDDSRELTAYSKTFIPGTKSSVIGDALEGFADKDGYYSTLADQLGNTSTMYFHLDKNGPTMDSTATVRVDASGTGFYVDVRGNVMDGVSGVASVSTYSALSTPENWLSPGPMYPPGPGSLAYNFTDITESRKIVFFDRSGWRGFCDLGVELSTENLTISNEGGINHESVWGHTGVILRDAYLNVSGAYIPQAPLPPGTVLKDTPAGMKVALWAVSEDLPEDPQESIPVEYGFPPVTTQKLFELSAAGSLNATFNLALRQSARLEFIETPSTNSVRYTYIENGQPRQGMFPPGYFKLGASGGGTAAYGFITALKHYNKWFPSGAGQSVQAGHVNVGITNVTTGGNITVDTARRTLTQPGYKMAESDVAYEIKTTAIYGGPVYINIDGLCAAGNTSLQISSPAILHCTENYETCTKIETISNECAARATVDTLSPFALMLPLDDVTAPQTELAMIGDSEVLNGELWITTDTYVDLTASDRATMGDISGVATMYYLVDVPPTPECLSTPYNPESPSGTCSNPRYNEAFSLAEGSRTLAYLSSDWWGNIEQPKTKNIFVDGTKPITALAAAWKEVSDAGTAYITEIDSIAVYAADPVSNGVASGIKTRLFYINAPPDSCTEPPTFTGPPGTCLNPAYAGPFTLVPGTYTIYYTASDRIGNQAVVKTAQLTVTPSDITPPVTTLAIDGTHYAAEGKTYIAPSAKLVLTAIDPEVEGMTTSGVDNIYYLVDAGSTVTYNSQPFGLLEGSHIVHYWSVDKAGNAEVVKSTAIHMDATPPTVPVVAALPQYSNWNDQTIIWPASQDDASGVAGYKVYGCSVADPAQTCTPSIELADTTLTNYADTSIKTDRSRYFYSVKAYDNVGLVSDASNIVNVTIRYAAAFSYTGSMNTARAMHTATVLKNGKVLVAGGRDAGGAFLSSAELYDPSSGAFELTGSLSTARWFHTATLLDDGRVLVAGGVGPNGSLSSAEIYDPVSGTFTSAGSMTTQRAYFSATKLNGGKVLLIGGAAGETRLSTAELYDPVLNTFTRTTGLLNVERVWQESVLLSDGKVLVVGGGSNSGPLATAELYDPSTGRFTYTSGSMTHERWRHGVTRMANNQVLIVGGVGNNNEYLASAEVYDPVQKTFSPTTGSLSSTKSNVVPVLLPDGRVLVLVTGGYSGAASMATAELFDPFTGLFSATASMNVPPAGPRALIFPAGRPQRGRILQGIYNISIETSRGVC